MPPQAFKIKKTSTKIIHNLIEKHKIHLRYYSHCKITLKSLGCYKAVTGFMAALQQADMLKAIVSSCCLSNYRDLFNLRHLVHRWCTTTHTFFLSCGEIAVTLEDVANQLSLPILGDVDPSDMELSPKVDTVEAELMKGMSGNAKLSHWAGAFSKASNAVRCAIIVAFWLCKFIFGSRPHYFVKPLYFQLAIKNFAGVSLPLALMFLSHLYMQLDIL